MEEGVEANSIKDFQHRIWALMQEATQYGIDGIFILLADDPLDRSETKNMGWTSGAVKGLGMLEFAKHKFLGELGKNE